MVAIPFKNKTKQNKNSSLIKSVLVKISYMRKVAIIVPITIHLI